MLKLFATRMIIRNALQGFVGLVSCYGMSIRYLAVTFVFSMSD